MLWWTLHWSEGDWKGGVIAVSFHKYQTPFLVERVQISSLIILSGLIVDLQERDTMAPHGTPPATSPLHPIPTRGGDNWTWVAGNYRPSQEVSCWVWASFFGTKSNTCKDCNMLWLLNIYKYKKIKKIGLKKLFNTAEARLKECLNFDVCVVSDFFFKWNIVRQSL